MGTKIEAPQQVSYGQQMADTLQAQVEMEKGVGRFANLGRRIDLEREYGPQYAQLQMDQLRSVTPQMLDLYTNQISPGLAQAEAASRQVARAGDIQSIEQLGPRARAAMQAANPDQAALVDRMTARANTALTAGDRLTPEQQRAVAQGSRAAFASRGLANSPNAAINEIVRGQLAQAGMGQFRNQQAMQALGAGQAFYGDPFQQILGRPSQAFGASGQLFGQAQAQGNNMVFNPESQLSASLTNMNYQGQLAANTASGANRASLFGAGLGAIGSIGGGMFAGGFFGK